MDVVYVVGHDTEELRYSLRSLSNIDHGTVWIVGLKPKWVRNVEHLPTRQNRSKFENSTANLLTAATHLDLSEEFAYFNDDFFAVQPTRVPTWHLGDTAPPRHVSLQQARRGASYRDGRYATWDLLKRWGLSTLNYEVHAPMIFDKEKLVEMLRRASRDHSITALHKRSLYGNLYEIGGRQVRDVKVGNLKDTWGPNDSWVSTNNKTFDRGKVGQRLRELFPDPCEYEE